MGTTTLAPCLWEQYCDDNGKPCAGGYLYTFEAGTDTPKTTYKSSAGDVAHANPIVLDAGGYVPSGLWLEAGAYKFILQDKDHTVIRTIDNVAAIGGGGSGTLMVVDSIAELRALNAGAAAVVIVGGYYARNDRGGGIFDWIPYSTMDDNYGTVIIPNSAPSQGRWKRRCGGEYNVRWFGAKGDGTTDDKTAVSRAETAAEGAGKVVYFDEGVYLVNNIDDNSIVYKLDFNAILKWSGANPRLKVCIEGNDTTPHFDCAIDDVPELICRYIRPEWFVGDHSLRLAIESSYVWNGCYPNDSPYILLGSNTYNIGHETDYIIKKRHVRIVGATLPNPASPAAGFISAAGGSVIRGRLTFDANNIELRNVAVDVGTSVSFAYYGGTHVTGIEIVSDYTKNNITIENVSVLGKNYGTVVDNGACGIKIRNAESVLMSNVSTACFDTGIHISASNLVASNIYCREVYYRGIHIVNDDTPGSTYGLANKITITNAYIAGANSSVSAVKIENKATQSANELTDVTVLGVMALGCGKAVEIVGGDTGSKTKRISVVTNNASGASSISGSKVDRDTVHIMAYMTGDGASWYGSEIDFHAHKAISLAGTNDNAIKILKCDEDTGNFKAPYTNDNYKTAGKIVTHQNPDTNKWDSKLSLKEIHAIEANEYHGNAFVYYANGLSTTMGLYREFQVFKSSGGTHGVALDFERLGVNKNSAVTVNSGKIFCMSCAKVGAISLWLDITPTVVIDKIYCYFIGNAAYMRPADVFPSGKFKYPVQSLQGGELNTWNTGELVASIQVSGGTSFIAIQPSAGYIPGIQKEILLHMTYPIMHKSNS